MTSHAAIAEPHAPRRAAAAGRRTPPGGPLIRATPARAAEATVGRADVRFGLVVAGAFLLTLLPRVLLHEMWRDEWQAWMLAATSPTLGELFARLRYEGHPGGWHLLIWLASRVWDDPAAMKLLHAAIAAGTAFVVAAYMPLSRVLRVLACLGYFVLFEYAAVSRNYGLGLLPLLGFAAVHTRRPHAWVWQGVLLAVAAQANLFAALLAGAGGCVAIGRWWADGRPSSGRFAVGAGVLGLGLLLCCVQVYPPEDRQYAESIFSLPMGDVAERGGRVAAGLWRSFAPLPDPSRAWWGNNVLDVTLRHGGLLKAVQPALGLLALGLIVWLLPRRRGAITMGLVGGGAFLSFLFLAFPGGLRHQGHWVVLALTCLWLGGGTATLPRAKRVGWAVVLGVQAVGGVIASVADVATPFSASRAVAEHIEAEYPPDVAIMGGRDFAVSPVSGVLGRPIYYPGPDRWGTFLKWDEKRTLPTVVADLSAAARSLSRDEAGRSRTVLLIVSDPVGGDALTANVGDDFKPVGRFADATVEDERYTLYEFAPPPRREGRP